MLRRALFALPALAFAAALQAAPSVGQPAPEIALKDAAGKPVKLSDYRGKYVVLEWTNPG
ncbi:MAG TPA: redoxin domain-containing protein, partial [Ramlibacter sp.]